GSLGFAGEELGYGGEGAVGGAAAGVDEGFGGLFHFATALGVAEELDPGDASVFRAFNLNGGAGGDKTPGALRAIFHRWAEDGILAEGGGLEDVVTAGGDE